MTRVVQMNEPGGPEVLKTVQVDLPDPGPGEIRLKQSAIGVNYHDVYVRSGLYRTLPLPGIPGIEAIGVVETVGRDVAAFAPGDRVGYVTGQYGCYAEARNLDASLAVNIPEELTDAQAAASLMKAFTVAMLVKQAHTIRGGDTILVHAAAGGVGQLLCSWASHLGARVIGTVGSIEKADVARAHGADDLILYQEEDVAARIDELTQGAGVSAVYDSVGADTFEGSIASLGFQGHMVCYGQASGPVPPFTMALLASRSLSVTRPIIFHYLRTPGMLAEISREVFDAFARNVIRPIEPLVLPFDEVGQAHEMLEARQSPGGIVLKP